MNDDLFATLIEKYHTNLTTGLSHQQVAQNTLQYGQNQLVTIKKQHPLVKFLHQFTNPLVLLLILISVALFIIGDHTESLLVFLMVFISMVLDFWQENRADHAVTKLQARVAHYCEVIRDGQKTSILATNLVPGDILILNTGDLISADGVVIAANDFFVNQAPLTGESFPVEKNIPPQNSLNNLDKVSNHDFSKSYLVFDGTSVNAGTATILVTTTGKATQFSQIAQSLNQAETPSQFTIGIANFSKLILKIVIVVILAIFVLYRLADYGWLTTLTFAVAIAVGITPDFLTVIMSLCMSYGAKKMADQGVIVKKMSAMPNFGSTEILCTDKTGTLTEDKISLIKHTNIFGHNDEQVLLYAQLNSHFQSGLTNSLDQAILEHQNVNLDDYEKIDEVPYDFERRAISVVVINKKTQEKLLITKGAPESIFAWASYYHDTNGNSIKINNHLQTELNLQNHLLTQDGFRVLAIAIKKLPTDDKHIHYSCHDERGLEIAGFASFLDPVKKDVRDTIKSLTDINVQVKVITGDYETIAQQVCTQAGITSERVLIGSEIEKLSDQELLQTALNVNIFARFSPIQKERIIKILRLSGKSIAYLGDGINDAPSLRAADVGISVDTAVDVAHEAADIILTHKSLKELRNGMIEGRKTFVNTMKYVRIGVASSFGNVISLVIASFTLPFLPMLPLQILLNDLLYDMSQLALASDNVDLIQVTKPQKWDLREVKRFIIVFGPLSSIFDLALFAVMYFGFHLTSAQFQTTWFVFSLFTQMLALFIMRTPRPLLKSHPHRRLLIMALIMSFIGVIVIFLPFTTTIFGFNTDFQPWLWLAVVAILSGYIMCLELVKKKYYQKFAP